MFIFCFLNNLFYKLDYDSDGRYKYDDYVDIGNDILFLEDEIKGYDVNNVDDLNIYVTTKSKIDVYKGMLGYDRYSWQYIKYNDYMYDVIYNINYYTYVSFDKDKLDKYRDCYELYSNLFKSNDYKYFINMEKRNISNKINDLSNTLNGVSDKKLYNDIVLDIDNYKLDLLIIDYRLNNDIDYGDNYLNRALVLYYDSIISKNGYKDKELNYDDRIEYNKIISDMYVNKYIIDNKVNVNKSNTVSKQLENITLDYEIFIIIIILIVSFIMIGEEVSKGYIKLLLVKPYSRSKIIISKILCGIIMIIISIMFLVILELVLGIIFLGVSNIYWNVIVYDFNIDSIREVNIFIYMISNIVVRMPMFIFILICSMFIGILFNNSIFSFAFMMIVYSLSSVINSFIVNSDIKIFKYVISLNWDFSNYMYGGVGNFRYLSLKSSIFIYVFYVIILITIMIIYFNRKDIKNI